MSDERLAARFSGGILDGQTAIVSRDWPLPDRIDGTTEPVLWDVPGHYAKVRQSTLDAAMPGVIRGAEYQWQDDPVKGDEK